VHVEGSYQKFRGGGDFIGVDRSTFNFMGVNPLRPSVVAQASACAKECITQARRLSATTAGLWNLTDAYNVGLRKLLLRAGAAPKSNLRQGRVTWP